MVLPGNHEIELDNTTHETFVRSWGTTVYRDQILMLIQHSTVLILVHNDVVLKITGYWVPLKRPSLHCLHAGALPPSVHHAGCGVLYELVYI